MWSRSSETVEARFLSSPSCFGGSPGWQRCQASEVLKLIRLWKRVNFKLTLSLRESSVLSQCLLDYPATIYHLTILFNTSEQIIKCENTFWQKPSYEKSKARRGPEWAKCSTYPLRHLWHLAPCGTWKIQVLILQCSSEHLSNFCIYGSGVWWTGGCFPWTRGCQWIAIPFHIIFDDKRCLGAGIISYLPCPLSSQEDGGIVSGRGTELGPDLFFESCFVTLKVLLLLDQLLHLDDVAAQVAVEDEGFPGGQWPFRFPRHLSLYSTVGSQDAGWRFPATSSFPTLTNLWKESCLASSSDLSSLVEQSRFLPGWGGRPSLLKLSWRPPRSPMPSAPGCRRSTSASASFLVSRSVMLSLAILNSFSFCSEMRSLTFFREICSLHWVLVVGIVSHLQDRIQSRASLTQK